MAKESLEARADKAVIKIEKKVNDIDNVLRDLSMKLCHVIKYKGNYYSMSEGIDYGE
jgi:hypothetical protein